MFLEGMTTSRVITTVTHVTQNPILYVRTLLTEALFNEQNEGDEEKGGSEVALHFGSIDPLVQSPDSNWRNYPEEGTLPKSSSAFTPFLRIDKSVGQCSPMRPHSPTAQTKCHSLRLLASDKNQKRLDAFLNKSKSRVVNLMN